MSTAEHNVLDGLRDTMFALGREARAAAAVLAQTPSATKRAVLETAARELRAARAEVLAPTPRTSRRPRRAGFPAPSSTASRSTRSASRRPLRGSRPSRRSRIRSSPVVANHTGSGTVGLAYMAGM